MRLKMIPLLIVLMGAVTARAGDAAEPVISASIPAKPKTAWPGLSRDPGGPIHSAFLWS